MKKINQKYLFINKTLFFPNEGILVIGDLHIGYEHLYEQSGLQISLGLTSQILDDLKKILNHIKAVYTLKKIVFIGDIKHYFNTQYEEKKEFFKILNLVEKYVKNPKTDIILIKGNHDTFDLTTKKSKKVHIEDDIAFTHGHRDSLELYDKKIKYVVMGHIHPSVKISEKKGVKKEIFKCFLEGKYKNKTFIVVPSFFNVTEGKNVNEFEQEYHNNFSIIPRRTLLNFKIHAVGELSNFETYDFGKVKDL